MKLIIGLLSQNENQRKKPCKHIYRLFQKENKTLYIDKEKKKNFWFQAYIRNYNLASDKLKLNLEMVFLHGSCNFSIYIDTLGWGGDEN